MNKSFVLLSAIEFTDEILNLIPKQLIEKYSVFPIEKRENVLIIATEKPEDLDMRDFLEQELSIRVEFVKSDLEDIKNAIYRYFGQTITFKSIIEKIDPETSIQIGTKGVKSVTRLALTEQPSVVELFDFLIQQSILKQASDIHIAPTEKSLLVRIRIDGVLHLLQELPKDFHQSLISAIKVEARMDISESRVPQDGEIEVEWFEKRYDLRVASISTIYGEKITIRILTKETISLGLDTLGFSETTLEKIQKVIHYPSGLVLIAGPTGSGKTTTLFSVLNELKDISKNIVTIEDPVEYRLPLVNQIEINEKAGLDFPTLCRSLLRQDSDVILLGEIRDSESAHLAVQSALVGTLLLSTIHSDNTINVVSRLLNMGVDRLWLGSVLAGIIAQRLVRKICSHCKVPDQPRPELLELIGLDSSSSFLKGEGCKVCLGTGYLGRICISEIIVVTSKLKDAIYDGKSPSELLLIAKESGFQPIVEDAKERLQLV